VDIIKLFYEEPVYLEALVADENPDARRRSEALMPADALLPGTFAEQPAPEAAHDQSPDALARPSPAYRLYIAGTDLQADRVGATAIANPGLWVEALVGALDGRSWRAVQEGTVRDVTPLEAATLLADPAGVTALAAGANPPAATPLAAVAAMERRAGVPRLLELLAAGTTVLFPEPAHHGADWAVFAPEPLKDAVAERLRRRQPGGARAFVVPYQQARGEHKFYFERWALDDLPDWAREVRPAGG
jgi:hypothetical protein